MKREFTFFDSYNTCSEENKESAKENMIENMFNGEDVITVTDNYGIEVELTREQYAKTMTDNDIYNECYEMESCWFSDCLSELDNVDRGNGVIAIANVGLWNGRRCGYKEYSKLSAIMYTSCDYEKVYVDAKGNLRKEESHHDGTNTVLYRYWKDGITEEQKENFKDKCYNGSLTARDISRYTVRCGKELADTFGWEVK